MTLLRQTLVDTGSIKMSPLRKKKEKKKHSTSSSTKSESFLSAYLKLIPADMFLAPRNFRVWPGCRSSDVRLRHDGFEA